MRNRVAALVVCVFIAGQAAAMAAPTPPNIVFIIADDMGFGDLGCDNPQSKIPTPHKDIVASLTTLLERYQNKGRSVPSRK